MAFNLKKVLKALLLSSGQPLSERDIQAAFARYHETVLPTAAAPVAPVASDGAIAAEGPGGPGDPGVPEPAEVPAEPPDDDALYRDVPSLVTGAQIREAMNAIAAELAAADDGVLLAEGAAGYRLVTAPRFARWIRILRQEPLPVRLSQSALETLAVVAYRQPVTRTEIETIRGVSAEAGLARLLERDLVAIVGRADQPGRPIQYGTTDAFLGFVGIKSLDELPASDVLTSRQIDEWLRAASSPRRPGDTDMGLENEQLPLDGAAAAPEAEPAAPAAP
jgi:segregation and condensation protein B